MRLYTVLVFCLLTLGVEASKQAITEEGDVVVLHDNGSWEYENGQAEEVVEITMNPAVFTKHAESVFQLKSTKTAAAFWINPKMWTFTKSQSGEATEYNFKLKEGDLYAMVISEQLEVEIETLADVAVENARAAAPDIRVVKREYRMVNDHKVIYMEMEGTIQGIKFTYMGYYYSDASGSTQYLTYTGTNLVSKYTEEIARFLNGLTTQ